MTKAAASRQVKQAKEIAAKAKQQEPPSLASGSKDIKKNRQYAPRQQNNRQKDSVPFDTKVKKFNDFTKVQVNGRRSKDSKPSNFKHETLLPVTRHDSANSYYSKKLQNTIGSLKKTIIESETQRKVSRIVSQMSQQSQSIVKDNVSVGVSRKVSVFEQISKLEQKKVGRAPFCNYTTPIKTIAYPQSPKISKVDIDTLSNASRSRQTLLTKPAATFGPPLINNNVKLVELNQGSSGGIPEQKSSEKLLWPDFGRCTVQNSEPPRKQITIERNNLNSILPSEQLNKNLVQCKEQQTSQRSKAEVGTQVDFGNKLPCFGQQSINSKLYENLLEISNGSFQQRMFLCAQLFFNSKVSESDIKQILDK